MQYTANLNLGKSEATDTYNETRTANNANWEILDSGGSIGGYVASGYTYIASGQSVLADIDHGLDEAPTQANGYVFDFYPLDRDAANELITVLATNIDASHFDAELDGVTVTANRYFTWVIRKVS
jgi:hypothetical protein